MRIPCALFLLLLAPPCPAIGGDTENPANAWVEWVDGYPVGQTDPFSHDLHRMQSLRLTSSDLESLAKGFPEWGNDPALLVDLFPHVYQSLQLKFDPHSFEERRVFVFDKAFEPHLLEGLEPKGSARTYSIHVDRYADPRYEGKYSGAILLVPGTGSYGGNYIKFALAMASLKGYIVYVPDLLYHGRSHGHKVIARNPEGEGTGVFLKKAISAEGEWRFENALEPDWEERESCPLKMGYNVTVIQSIGRRIAQFERENLKHLDSEILTKPTEQRDEIWYGKPTNSLTHVTLIGTSQGGETAFWAADPRGTGQGGQAAYGIFLPFDSVICHDIYNTAETAPQSKMRWLRSGFPGGLIAGWMEGRDSLWQNADWRNYYDGVALFLRACDRWVRWRYDMEAYRDLLRYGRDHHNTLPQMEIPILVAIGRNDRLYSDDKRAKVLVADLFEELERDPAGESLWHLQFDTPENTNGHQLLVHHSLPFVEMADAWIRYRRGGPGSSFQYSSGEWKRIQ